MNVFVLTDNRLWLKKAKEIFAKYDYKVSFFCSPKGAGLFENEINTGEIESIDVKESSPYLIANYNLGFSCHCKQIFPQDLVEAVRCINIHPGLNPYNRGWFPQVFSILNKKPIGATIHLMDAEVDHGDILYQKEIPVFDWDTSKSIYDRVVEAEFALFEEHFGYLINGTYSKFKMHDNGNYNSIADYKALLEIDMDAKITMREAIEFLRAMTHPPYKNAYFLTEKGERVFVGLDIEKERFVHYYVRLKPGHQLTAKQAGLVKEMELATPEERFPFEKDAEGSHLIEVYCKGTLQECQGFIAAIQDEALREQFEIFSR